MNIHENYNQVTMMIWETNPYKRNINNVIKVNSKVELGEGDAILGSLIGDATFSTYMLDKIIDVRDSSLKGYKYYTIESTFKYTPATKLLEKLQPRTKKMATDLIRKIEEEKAKKKKQWKPIVT